MKYLVVAPNGGFPLAVLFGPSISHAEMERALDCPVLSAGFVSLHGGKARCVGSSSSLNKGPGPFDADLIQAAIDDSNKQFPPAPRG